ncbi:hypothetical protein KL930_002100 [Ogataea haglerorum]|uniref:Prokaryotic-type class I peptide chain release factors domain-containing protein n=1 Tax=Ogataea haglerorum TaxID=1937702 RepID=A0AAN6I118_9ASCO|nr:hypothetical protein KL915_001405 [Ogataea haglerorum]KAG7700715.1 hypothetical protein KL951_000830 [Ogataea haglerorum]KAG7710155.1 hypothetical protein KL914_001065 [Ogataea haglerorum]KAG7711064.1 hypothetical protein KL950_001030 [Ogataea haglerorum]KAG7720362.1 hypothetical protein KL913_001262 [Ogataea haglerorum]
MFRPFCQCVQATRQLATKIPRANKLPPRPKLSEDEIAEKFIKGGSGKGGQKINKTNSKVQLTHIPTGLVVTSQATRSREQNRKIARELLAAKIDEMRNGENSRAAIVALRKKMVKERAKRKTKAKYKQLGSKSDPDIEWDAVVDLDEDERKV